MTTAIEDAIAALCLAKNWIDPGEVPDDALAAIDEALVRLTAEQARVAPGMTDLMVPPETLDAWLDANPLPVSPDRERLARDLEAGAEWIETAFSPDVGETPISKRMREAAAALRSPADGWRPEEQRQMNEALHYAAEGLDMALAMVEEDNFIPNWDYLRSIRVKVKRAMLPIPSPPAEEKTP